GSADVSGASRWLDARLAVGASPAKIPATSEAAAAVASVRLRTRLPMCGKGCLPSLRTVQPCDGAGPRPRRGWNEPPPPSIRLSAVASRPPGRRITSGEGPAYRGSPETGNRAGGVALVQDDRISLVQAEEVGGTPAVHRDGHESGGVLHGDALSLGGGIERRDCREEHVPDPDAPPQARLLEHGGPHVELHVPEAVDPRHDAVDPSPPHARGRDGDTREPLRRRH